MKRKLARSLVTLLIGAAFAMPPLTIAAEKRGESVTANEKKEKQKARKGGPKKLKSKKQQSKKEK